MSLLLSHTLVPQGSEMELQVICRLGATFSSRDAGALLLIRTEQEMNMKAPTKDVKGLCWSAHSGISGIKPLVSDLSDLKKQRCNIRAPDN